MADLEQLQAEGVVDYGRGSDFWDPTQHPHAHVTLVGIGGANSPVALCLAQMGMASMTLVDPDNVERHNLPNQMFFLDARPTSQVISAKVTAMMEVLRRFGTGEVDAYYDRIQEVPQALRGVVVLGTDTIQSRKETWELIKQQGNRVELVIDIRLGGRYIRINAINPLSSEEQEYYEQQFDYTDENAEEAPCTGRSIMYVGYQVASQVSRLITEHFMGREIEHTLVVNMGENLSMIAEKGFQQEVISINAKPMET